MEQPVTVAIIEDHPVVTEGVASWIRSDPGQRVRLVQTARDLAGLRAVPRPLANVVILDLELSGELVTTQIPGLVAAGYRVVAFSGHSDPAIVMETLDNGAHAYVSKEEGRDHLVEAVLAAAADRPYVTRSQARAMLADQAPGPAGAVGAGAAGAAAVVPGHVESIGRAAHVDQREHGPAVHQTRARQVRGHRADRAEQGRAARPRDRGRRDRAGRDHAVQVIRPRRGRPPQPGCPRPVNGPGHPSPPRSAPQPNRPQAGAGPHGRAPRRHQIAGWRTVSIPDRGRHCHDARSGDTTAGWLAGEEIRASRGGSNASQPPVIASRSAAPVTCAAG